MSAEVLVVATMDTKADEATYIASRIRESGLTVRTVDVGTSSVSASAATVPATEIYGGELPSWGARAEAVAAMAEAFKTWLLKEVQHGKVQGVLGLGGSGGTALISEAMRALPIGLPKVLVSTMASGNTQPYVDCSDITMMYSVVDVAGINSVSERIFRNAAAALVGMASQAKAKVASRNTLGMTMFGVTTSCVTNLRKRLEAQGYDCLVFHATGTGGRAMEKLVESQFIEGVIDVTTTEIADEIAGGIMPCGPNRLNAILAAKIPYVLSLGAVDMVNFGAMDTVPPRYRHRQLYAHNEHITLMRTSLEENLKVANWLCKKLENAKSRFTVVIPEAGVSALDDSGKPFYAPEIDAALFSEIEQTLQDHPWGKVVRSPWHINDPGFSQLLEEEFLNLVSAAGQSKRG